MLPILTVCSLVLLGADAEPWSPYDQFFEPDKSCDVVAAVPGPAGSVLLGTTCNRLDGKEIGPLIALDPTGAATPLTQALAASVPGDRMQELSQLIVHRDGWVVTQGSRAKGAPRVQGVNFPAAHRLIRLDSKGARDATFNNAVQGALDARFPKGFGILDVAADAKGQLIVGAAEPESGGDAYLKRDRVVVLRFDDAGKVVSELKLNDALKSIGLGYYEVLALRPRPDGGLFVGGRFQSAPPSDRIFLLAFDSGWKLDAKFNGAVRQYSGYGKELEIRLLVPDGKGAVWAIGEWNQNHVVRVAASGTIDPAFKPYRLPGTYPQGRFLRPSLAARDAEGNLWLSFGNLPGKSPPWVGPGLVKLRSDGTPDGALAKALGRGFWHEPSTKGPDAEAAGSMTLLAPMPDGSVIVAGHFDHLGTEAVASPVRLTAAGKRDPAWAPKLSTELPPKKVEPNAKTSAFFKADGKLHYVACKGGKGHAITLIYDVTADPWGHDPCCYVHYGGDLAEPGGAWQDCDKRATQAQAEGAKCAETSHNPLDIDGHR